MKVKPTYIIIIILVILLGLAYYTRPSPIIQTTKKEYIIQKYRDTIEVEKQIVKWKTKKVFKTIYQLDTIRDTTILVEVQKEVIYKLVDITKDQDTIITTLWKVDSLNQAVIKEVKEDNKKKGKRIKTLGTFLKVTVTALGIFITKDLLNL